LPGYAVAVLLNTPHGIPLIRDPKKPAPIFWKLPGGRSEGMETAEQSAIRELAEEVGIALSVNDLTVVHVENKVGHTLTIFRADLDTLPKMKSEGDEGEEIKVFKPSQILRMTDFFPNHRKVIGSILASLE
jgi:ADP-ribose pyrophosphatase YjhB (NUDIX family)